MTQRRRNWTEDEIAHLFEMREVQKLKWREIAAQLGETVANCCTRYHQRKSKQRIAEAREAARARAAALARLGVVHAPQPVAPRPAPMVTALPLIQPAPVQRPRYFHDADNDIRARIARQGITAGFLGDPPPGRSALDQRQRQS